jgi:hypothetical protein
MTNPLLQPDDRFRPRQSVRADGSNPFAEGDALLEAEAGRPERAAGTFAAPVASDQTPFQPQYEVTAEHRGGMLLIMSLICLAGACLGTLVSWVGWLLPLLAIVPGVTVIFLAAEDLKMMRLGGRNPEGRLLTWVALILSTLMVLILGTMIGFFIYWGMNLIPEWMQ